MQRPSWSPKMPGAGTAGAAHLHAASSQARCENVLKQLIGPERNEQDLQPRVELKPWKDLDRQEEEEEAVGGDGLLP